MKQNKFINRGLGYIYDIERDQLIRAGAIKNIKGIDTVICDYPKLVIFKNNGESTTIDIHGDITQLNIEMDKAIKNGKKAVIQYFPRTYADHLAKKKAKMYAEVQEQEAQEALINNK